MERNKELESSSKEHNKEQGIRSKINNLELENKLLFEGLQKAQEEIFKYYGNPPQILEQLEDCLCENIKKDYSIKAARYLLNILNKRKFNNTNCNNTILKLIYKKKIHESDEAVYSKIKYIFIKSGKKGIEEYIESNSNLKCKISEILVQIANDNMLENNKKLTFACLELAVAYDIFYLKNLILYLHFIKKDIFAFSLITFLPRFIELEDNEVKIFKDIEEKASEKFIFFVRKKLEKLRYKIKPNPFKLQIIDTFRKISIFTDKINELEEELMKMKNEIS